MTRMEALAMLLHELHSENPQHFAQLMRELLGAMGFDDAVEAIGNSPDRDPSRPRVLH